MYLFGISCGGESGAALFKDSQLICAINEERFSRKKLDTRFPANSIEWCLNNAEITPEQVSCVIYGFSSGSTQNLPALSCLADDFDPEQATPAENIIRQRVTTEKQIDREKYTDFRNALKTVFSPDIPIVRFDHHFSHIASAFVPSGMEEALVVTADGRGDFRSLTVGIANRQGYTPIYSAPSWHSLGYFYGRMTKLCGFTANRHEGKVTGLAAFGDPLPAKELVRKIIRVEQGQVIANLGDFYRPFFSHYSERLLQAAGSFSPEDLAAATQTYFVELFVELIRFYIKKTGQKNICLSGGVFSNISLNQAIYEIDKEIDVFVYPNMGDAGICTGSCYAWLWRQNQADFTALKSVYLGYELQPSILKDILVENGYPVYMPDNPYRQVTDLLRQGNSVALVTGKAEFGPRALGNRTVLASPMIEDIDKKINSQLQRDRFMPLAPVIPLSLADEFLFFKNKQSDQKGFFMTMTFKAKPRLKEVASAIVHVDGTVRPQIVTPEQHPFLHDLLLCWYQQTGCPALINTSFNLHEEPIVNDEKDILKTFSRGAVDYLLFPPYLTETGNKA